MSLITAVFIFDSINNQAGVIVVGLVEETAKVVVVAWFLKQAKYNYILNGLLIGAAVGTGFAAFESAGYAMSIAMSSDLYWMYDTIFWRGVLSPGGHIVWAALCGAAICMVKGNREFNWSMLKDFRFVRIFLIVVALHSLWNLPWLNMFSFPLVQIGLMVVSWIIAFGMMNLGLKEISQLKQKHTEQETAAGIVNE